LEALTLRTEAELAMQMRVREIEDRIYIELSGVAGRQQSVLRALTRCRLPTPGDDPLTAADVSVRAGANDMRICFHSRPGLRVEASDVYRAFRNALFAPDAASIAPQAVAG
jgi:hypothetical protein